MRGCYFGASKAHFLAYRWPTSQYDGEGPKSKGDAVGHEMFDFDAEFGDAVFDYCRERLSMDPVPLDFGALVEIPDEKMAGLIRPEGRSPEAVLDFFRTTLAPSVVSIDSPGFLAFIPNAPTKNSLLFDMVVACSGLNRTSWLQSTGVVVAENQALTYLADL